MRVYRLQNGIVLVGKAREVRAKLRECGQTFRYVRELISRA
ncbi:Z-ring formation inhibitor MciZ [Bacillus atrophaeus]|uniref:Z-ring formation inhibitor MciZ n=1 Tax=Bacillus atrophaeus (strain 1942) TaxID=720555 RepID=A0ABM5LYM5_BACA1|nr:MULTISPECIES: Z-ring formation inhibitor MciZ [Bacillus]AMR62263.1 cell division protein [Bacillus subtilis subsp. globigii]ADP32952.1 hypothetical protein BATR1942_10095 [Bacillus atrophaeus 1942]AIK48798.1 hypothetical protein DJ95_1905 [Bacillus atrophaeus subsp. globigii]AKL85041.1 hypothetical protein D068_cds24040 [Bacillus atrophaeus UCMB-5137]ARW07375.1 hypothetical protein S101359_02369 [Bacillus atrophaeus]